MIIDGPNAVGLNCATQSKEAHFVFAETGQAAAITKGYCCVFEVATDNSAVAGIMQNTYGFRIIVAPAGYALNFVAGVAHKAIAAFAAFASARGETVALMSYGWRDDIPIDTAGADNDTIVGGLLIPSTDTAGKLQGCGTNTVAGITGGECAQRVGIANKIVAVNSTDTIEGLINVPMG